MERARKITIAIAPELLDKPQRVTGAGITQTVRMLFTLVLGCARHACSKRRSFSAAYKKKILTEVDAAAGTGRIGEILRREGLAQ